MKIIGITGGVGSGKSTVLTYLEQQYNAHVIQADLVGHAQMLQGETGYDAIVEQFGTEILDQEQQIDRKKLGSIVFRDEEKLKRLNGIIHPAVKKAIKQEIDVHRNETYIIIEAALLIEGGYDSVCDELWYIYADQERRRQRLRESRAYSDEKIDAIMSRQQPEHIFRTHCRHVIDNSGKWEETTEQVDKILNNGEEQ